MAGKQQERVNVEGHELTLTNLGKIIYPETGTTKAEVLEYYAAVAPFLIPAAANRPVTRKRWVNGVGTAEHPGQVFFQKNLEDSAPKWIPRAAIQHSDHSNVYPMVNNLATLTWMAQIASLEIHVPQWQVDAAGKPLRPDRFVLDLDPGPGAGLPECVEVAKLARSILQDMGMDPVPVTSGSKGIHLYTGLDGTLKSEQVSAFAHELARALESDHPELVVSDMKKSLRKGKVLVDWSQNSGNKTTIVPYSLRGRAFPTVAAPRTWRELASVSLEHLDFLSVMKRVKTGKDHFAPISERHLPPHGEDEKDDGGAAAGSSGSSGTGSSGSAGSPRERVVTVENRLAKYVGMRDPDKTPEPFPSSSAVSSDAAGRSSSDQPKPGEPPPPGGIFVIQEHHARRYHLDFRLEHEGVLASWALPRGVPETTDRNNLAVHTEDHPMDYATFAGVIPKGEYGAGTVSIWDRGEYTCEKWRDGKEVIATLTGEPGGGLGGTRRFALINTGQNWLIHLMKEQPGGRHGGPSPGKAAPKPEPTQPTPSTPQPMPNYTPMLATSGTTAELRGDDWLYELKWDGIRAIITGTEGKIRLMSRNGNDLTATYPEVTDRGSWPEGNFVADGEIVALGKGSRPDFGRLQLRMNLVKTADIERARASVPVQLMLFDLLYDDGTDLSGLPFRERRERLSGFAGRLRKDSPVHLSAVLDHDVEDLMTSAAELGLEGVMAKKADSRYVIGRRSRSWIKLKLEQSQEVVVGGWRPGAGARSGTFGALLLGIPDGGKLHYVGRVGTGFKDWQLRDIMEHLEPRVVGESPFADIPREDAAGATWVSPELVAEVTFGEWTGPGRLRHPVWRGWRPDKSPDDVSQPN